MFSFALKNPTSLKIYKEPRSKLFKKINKSVLSHVTFYIEDDDHKPVDFNNETIIFTCQLKKIKQSNLNMIRPKNKTEHLLLSVTKKRETLIKQTHTQPQETLEIKPNKTRETFSFKQSVNLGLDSNWIVGFINLEV